MQRLPAALPRLSVPLLVLRGTDDPICPLAGSVMGYEAVSSADKTLRRYPGLYHEVYNEPEREQILTDLIFWLTVGAHENCAMKIAQPTSAEHVLELPIHGPSGHRPPSPTRDTSMTTILGVS